MKVWSQSKDGGMVLGAMRCDRCLHTVSAHRSEDNVDEMREFVHIELNAGPGASHFAAGDTLVTDLCERCAHELLAPSLRRVQSASGEIDFPFLDLSELGFDAPDDEPPLGPSRH